MVTANHTIKFKAGRRTAKVITSAVDDKPKPPARLPRITKMMALAIRLDQLIKSGQVTDQAELARVGHVSRARLTQIMNLLQLAPDIQEELLHLPRTESGRDAVTERDLRTISGLVSWKGQRRAWMQTVQASQ